MSGRESAAAARAGRPRVRWGGARRRVGLVDRDERGFEREREAGAAARGQRQPVDRVLDPGLGEVVPRRAAGRGRGQRVLLAEREQPLVHPLRQALPQRVDRLPDRAAQQGRGDGQVDRPVLGGARPVRRGQPAERGAQLRQEVLIAAQQRRRRAAERLPQQGFHPALLGPQVA
jgi:hypothetical protein